MRDVTFTFTSSDTFADEYGGALGPLKKHYEDAEYAELTYNTLRVGPNGDTIAYKREDGGWVIDGMAFSDVAITMEPHDSQPTPDALGDTAGDPRLSCWFDGSPSVALAPRHSGGDVDRPAHWVPVCQHHADHWHDETDEAEHLPLIPRFGLALFTDQARALLAAICEDSGDFRDSVNQEVDGLHDAVSALVAGLRAYDDDNTETGGERS